MKIKRVIKTTLIIIISIIIIYFMFEYRENEELRTLFIFTLYFILSLIFKIDPRYPVMAAIGCLILAAMLLAFGNETLANKIAIYAYYFLVVGVLLNIVEYIKEKK